MSSAIDKGTIPCDSMIKSLIVGPTRRLSTEPDADRES